MPQPKKSAKTLPPITPGEILQEEFMRPLGLSQNKLARDLFLPAPTIHDLVHGKRGITIDTAYRLGVYFNTTPQFWLNLQMQYDLRKFAATKKTTLQAIQPHTTITGTGAMV